MASDWALRLYRFLLFAEGSPLVLTAPMLRNDETAEKHLMETISQ